MSLHDGFYLPVSKAKEWYGISSGTAEAGFGELQDLGILMYEEKYIRNNRSRTGWQTQRIYHLLDPYQRKVRNARAEQQDRSG